MITYLVTRGPPGATSLASVAATAEPTGEASPSPVPTSTAAHSQGPGTATATPSGTSAPPPTATATPTPKLAPTPVTITLQTPTSGGGRVSGEHKGLFGIVWAAALSQHDTGAGRLEVAAYVPTIGSGERPVATGWLQRSFGVPAALGARVAVQVSGDVEWNGTLAGNGVAGTGTDIEVTLKLLEGTRVVAQSVVHSKGVRESALSVGGQRDSGTTSATLATTVVGGRTYILRLEAQCTAATGAIGAVVHCIYSKSDTYPDGYVDWDGFQVTLIP